MRAFLRLLRCPLCGSFRQEPEGCCARCRSSLLHPLHRPGLVALGPYQGRLKRAVGALKFRHTPRLAALLGQALAAEVVRTGWNPDGICPVPLHRNRLRRRGYHQTRLLAQALAKSLDLPVAELLVRTRDTPSQTKLSPRFRRANVAGAFRSLPARGRRILLVDDVRTTGATIDACAQALRSAGAVQVYMAVVAVA